MQNFSDMTFNLYKYKDLFSEKSNIEIDELDLASDPYFEGYINHIYRVKQGTKKYIIKHATNKTKLEDIGISLDTSRNRLEYLSYKLRALITPKYIPELYYCDINNDLFIMEDLSHMSLLRRRMSLGHSFEHTSALIGDFMAHNHFFTSQLYLSNATYYQLNSVFLAAERRKIMEDFALYKMLKPEYLESKKTHPFREVSEKVWNDYDIHLKLIEMRDVLKNKCECLIHGDLHTSNIFVDEQRLAVVDMEYSFMGPYGYDIGYLLANYISQWAAFNFNSDFSSEKRALMRKNILNAFEDILLRYFFTFEQLYLYYGKDIYLQTKGYLESLFESIIQDSVGFMATVNIYRIINMFDFPDFDVIKNKTEANLAKCLSLYVGIYLLKNKKSFKNVKDIISAIEHVQKSFFAMLN